MYTREHVRASTNHMHAFRIRRGRRTDMDTMAATLRLSVSEQEQIRQKCIEINKLLVKMGKQPMRDSELVHKILGISIACAKLNKEGEVELEGCEG